MVFQFEGAWSFFSFREFRLLHCVSFCIFCLVFEQSYRVTNGVANLLMRKNIVEFVPSLGFAIQLGKADSGCSNFLEDVVDHSNFLGTTHCVSVFFKVGANDSSEIPIAFVV